MEWFLDQTKAVGSAIEDTRSVFSSGNILRDPLVFITRLGAVVRSNNFLWAEANLKTLERYSRVTHMGRSLSRRLTLNTLAADIVVGYMLLDERGKLSPRLAQPQDWEWQHQRSANRILDTAATLGGTLIKACQFASTRPDILPAPYVQTLSTLQDRVPSHPWLKIERVIRQELGRSPQEVFERIEPTPVASASIAQVHRAWLTAGRQVAVKVQYPEIADIIATDLTTLQRIVKDIARLFPSVQLQPILNHLKETLPLELDFQREAAAMMKLRAALQHRTDVLVPRAIPELSTRHLIVMEFIDGIKITDREAMVKAGISPQEVARLLNDVYAEQFFRLGMLHADPHPGNLFVQPGPKLVVLDHGLTVPLKPTLVHALAEMVQALVTADFGRLANALAKAGLPLDQQTGITTLMQLVGVLLGEGQDKAAPSTLDVGQQLGKSIGHIPVDLLLVGRALGLLDGITRQLDPDMNALEIVAGYVQEMGTAPLP